MINQIFDRQPETWSELQDMVGQLFTEVGCEVQVSHVVALVRGQKEIDVYAKDPLSVPTSVYLCECKHWERRISQETVHAFRSVIADQGANRGYIISKSGFQSGAYEAAKNTNIELVTFDELQEIFVHRWHVHMAQQLMPFADRLFRYWDPTGGAMPTFQWVTSHRERHRLLVDAFKPLINLGPSFLAPRLPLAVPILDEKGLLSGERMLSTARQFYDFITTYKDDALYHFQVLHGEIQPHRLEGEYDPMANVAERTM